MREGVRVSESWICKDPQAFSRFVDHIVKNWDYSKALSVQWSAGVKRSMGQLSLCHVWIRAMTDYINGRVKGTDCDEETMKTSLKREFGIRITICDPITGKDTVVLKSLGRYEKGEMLEFMQRIDAYAAGIGCLLPVYGEYETLRAAA